MSERLTNSGERGGEQNQEALDRARQERQSEIERGFENTVEHRENIDEARNEALEKATPVERERAEDTAEVAPQEKQQTALPNTKAGRVAAYDRTMKEVQSEMSAPSRTFSKVIHNKAVEKTSEVVGATIARPNAILSGAVFALLLTLAFYLTTKYFGYTLSGFETIGAFILGWAIGLLYDYLRLMISGKRL